MSERNRKRERVREREIGMFNGGSWFHCYHYGWLLGVADCGF